MHLHISGSTCFSCRTHQLARLTTPEACFCDEVLVHLHWYSIGTALVQPLQPMVSGSMSSVPTLLVS